MYAIRSYYELERPGGLAGTMSKARPVVIGDRRIAPGQRAIVDLPVADLYTHTQLTMPVHVINGRRPGPALFLTAALHGDELNGVEIINRRNNFV